MREHMLECDIERVLLTEEELSATVSRIAAAVDAMYGDPSSKLVLLCILKGSVVFMGELMKHITVPAEIEFMKASSYGEGTVSSGEPGILLDIERADLAECDILIVEDIVDSGRTLSHLVRHLRERGARSVRTCALLDKPDRREVDFAPDIVGEVIPDEFVVGYGLDYAERYRALPYVGVLKREIYEK